MSLVRSTDEDFRVCALVLADLIALQQEAERRGFSTRWTSVSALLGHVEDKPLLLMTLLREERNEMLRAYRCLVQFQATDPREGEMVVATIDVAPGTLNALTAAEGDRSQLAAEFMRLPAIFKP